MKPFLFIAAVICVIGCNQQATSPKENNENWFPVQTVIDSNNPMINFAPFIGDWDCVERIWLPGGSQDSILIRSHIYMMPDQKTLCVDEMGVKTSYRFIGYHKYDSSLGVYLNFGASNDYPAGGWVQEIYDAASKRFVFNKGSIFLYNTSDAIQKDSPIVIKDITAFWEIRNENENRFYAWTTSPDGKEIPLKEGVYRRRGKN